MDIITLDNILRRTFGESESWDNDGIMLSVGNDIERAVIALDATSSAIDYAVSVKADTLITHHPLVFHPLSTVRADDSVGLRVINAAKQGVSVISYHSCLDITPGGVNDCLCEKLGIENTTAFLPFARVGYVKEQSFAQMTDTVASRLSTAPFMLHDAGRPVHCVAVISGGGKDYIKDVLKTGADTFITGEVNHAAVIDCAEYGINLICGGHRETERVVLPFLSQTAGKYIETAIFAEGFYGI